MYVDRHTVRKKVFLARRLSNVYWRVRITQYGGGVEIESVLSYERWMVVAAS